MADLTLISAQYGIPVYILVLLIIVFVLLVIWEAIWKLLAMWKAAKKGSVAWFIVLAIFNTLGNLPILYIFIFSKKQNKNGEIRIRKIPPA